MSEISTGLTADLLTPSKPGNEDAAQGGRRLGQISNGKAPLWAIDFKGALFPSEVGVRVLQSKQSEVIGSPAPAYIW